MMAHNDASVIGGSGIGSIAADASDDNALYNIFGQRIDKSYKGIVISNGRKS